MHEGKWTRSEDERLIDLIGRGFSKESITDFMGRTPSAVRTRRFRLGKALRAWDEAVKSELADVGAQAAQEAVPPTGIPASAEQPSTRGLSELLP